MQTEYKRTKTTVSYIHYHFVFCPRYRRKIFNIPGLEQRFREMVREECARRRIELLAVHGDVDHAYVEVRVLPETSVHDAVKYIKSATSALRHEFARLSAMPSLWTRCYFVSTEESLNPEVIRTYVESQKTRP
ncbi:MAG: IS200/IS605 family transposase [Desulfovibrio sp.]|nr:IS200/IS605 family transposase [Desulfovibrio sp.]